VSTEHQPTLSIADWCIFCLMRNNCSQVVEKSSVSLYLTLKFPSCAGCTSSRSTREIYACVRTETRATDTGASMLCGQQIQISSGAPSWSGSAQRLSAINHEGFTLCDERAVRNKEMHATHRLLHVSSID